MDEVRAKVRAEIDSIHLANVLSGREGNDAQPSGHSGISA
jgi:hypothetical protein